MKLGKKKNDENPPKESERKKEIKSVKGE